VLTYGVKHSQGYGSLALRATVVGLPCDQQRDSSVASTDNRDAPKVSSMQVTLGGMNRVHGQKYRPADQANDVDTCSVDARIEKLANLNSRSKHQR